jgi:hypothetical protein
VPGQREGGSEQSLLISSPLSLPRHSWLDLSVKDGPGRGEGGWGGEVCGWRRTSAELPYTIEVVDDDATLTARAGLPIVLETMRAVGLSDELDRTLAIRRRNTGATDAQKVEALVLLMAAGGECVDDIEVLRADKD